MATWWSPVEGGITVALRVTPGARRTEVIESSADRLRLRLAAPPVDGKANAELVRFFARCFGVRRSAVSLVRGEHSRDKVVRVDGVAAPPPGFDQP